jgi:hypothetical protein
MANLVVSAVSTWDNSGLKKGQKSLSAFDRSIKNLGKTLGTVFAVTELINFSKKAVDAFSKDQAAAKALETQLKNTGYAFSSPDIEYYIANLQGMTGVLDDHLRPAFQSLLTASGSLVQSQKALAIALDVSAATGKSVEEVSMAMAKGFTGQTTALGRLGAGLSKATLASGDMNLIMDELGNKFTGQAQARLETYAGKMDLLKTSAANATETIGKGLLDALSVLGKDQNISNLGSSLEKLATTIANVIVGLGTVLGKVISIGQAIFSKLHLDKVIGFLYNNSLISKLANLGASESAKPKSNFTYSLGSGAGVEIAKKKESDLLKKTNAARAAELAALKKKSAVDQLKDKFDLERIGLTVALNSATDEETKLRLKAQLAILDNNEVLAKKYLAEMNAANAADTLATSAKNAAQALGGILNLLGRGGDQGPGQAAQGAADITSFSTNISPNAPGGPGTMYGRSIGDQNPNNLINVTVNANNLIDPNQLAPIIQDTILRINRAGNQLSSTGGL